jgi:hypothetical protein
MTSENENNEEPLLSLDIQLDENRIAEIIIKEGDDIEQVVEKFCADHDFDENIKDVIMDQLREKLNSNIEECIN